MSWIVDLMDLRGKESYMLRGAPLPSKLVSLFALTKHRLRREIKETAPGSITTL